MIYLLKLLNTNKTGHRVCGRGYEPSTTTRNPINIEEEQDGADIVYTKEKEIHYTLRTNALKDLIGSYMCPKYRTIFGASKDPHATVL